MREQSGGGGVASTHSQPQQQNGVWMISTTAPFPRETPDTHCTGD